MSLPTCQLGKGGPQVTKIGYGAMGISAFYDTVIPDEKAFEIFDKLLEEGCTFWDTAYIYNNNEEVLGRYFAKSGNRSKVFLCTKCGIDFKIGVCGKPEVIKKQCSLSLEHLGVDTIDLYYLHRIDPDVPIEKSVGAMAELVKEGKVKHLGLSECSAETLRRAYKIHPISAVQIEYSLFSHEAERNGLLDACKELGVSVVAYSPLGRGVLTGAFKSLSDFSKDDWRSTNPRFQKESYEANMKLVDEVEKIAEKKGATPGQIALAWVMEQGGIPIPGSTKIHRVVENIGSVNVKLSADDMAHIRELIDKIPIIGDRYASTNGLYGDSRPLDE
ncbi:NADP-dependent oxidoreductase domain-containing protein [Dipodascopsis uninucleata]